MTLLLLLPSLALAATTDPTIAVPGAAPAPEVTAQVPEHITVREGGLNALPDATNIAVAITCQPAKPSKFDYLAPELTDYTSENAAFIAAVTERSDIHLVAHLQNATPTETIAWFKALDEQFDEPVRELIITVSCPAWGGDTDEEVLLMNGGTLSFADLLTVAKPIARSSIWGLDASRNVSAALESNTPSFGPTADDVVKYGIVPDALAISSSAPGKYGGPGLIGAMAKVIAATKGGRIDLQALYHLGVKPAVPTLELYTSMGINEVDAWNGNLARSILLGGPLIVPIADVKPPVEPKKPFVFRPSHGVIAGGGASLIASAAFAVSASNHYDTLDTYNRVGGESQEELTAEVSAYRLNTGLSIGLGALGVIATGVGIGWTVVDQGDTTVALTPMGNGVAVTMTR